MTMKSLAAAGVALILATPAQAHIVFDDTSPTAGGYHAGFLRVGHGCGEAASREISVSIPEGLAVVRPQPKPGWTLHVEYRDPAKRDSVARIVWTGELPPDQFEQFGILMKLPEGSAALYFPTAQSCVDGAVNDWSEIPDSPAQWHEKERPAPMLVPRVNSPAAHNH